ncbi:MAG: sigma-70 family RNA polymerase sigma factor [Anaerolineaceae bacterium]|nr:sigma-70 family RNA polymerase sigma factor [Anaerolineaceae bacterium]
MQIDLPKVFNYFRYCGLDDDISEELASTTFEKAWRARNKYNPEKSAVTTWIITIAKHTLIDYYRTKKTVYPIDMLDEKQESGSQEHNLEEDIQQTEIFEKLKKLLFQLPDRERELVALKYGTGMTNRDIAEFTGLTESNIGTILHRVVSFLRMSLEVKNE